MCSPIVRRLTAAVALLLVLTSAAPALAASGPPPTARPHAPRGPVVTGVSLLDKLLDWLGFQAAGPLPGARGTQEKSGIGSLLDPLYQVLDSEDHGPMIDPNG
jgi:hypothetical protein